MIYKYTTLSSVCIPAPSRRVWVVQKHDSKYTAYSLAVCIYAPSRYIWIIQTHHYKHTGTGLALEMCICAVSARMSYSNSRLQMQSSLFSVVYSCAVSAHMSYSNSRLRTHNSLFNSVYSRAIRRIWGIRIHNYHCTALVLAVCIPVPSRRIWYSNSWFRIHSSRFSGVYSCAMSARMNYTNTWF